MNFASRTITLNEQYLATGRAIGSVKTGRLAKDNTAVGSGATTYGEIKAGTLLAADAAGLLHPCGWQDIAATVTTANDVQVDDATNFYVGDTVDVYDASNSSIATGRTVSAINYSTNTLTLSGATFSAAVNDFVIKAVGFQPVGFLATGKSTLRYVNNVAVAQDVTCAVRYEGDIIPSKAIGVCPSNQLAMAGGAYTDPKGATVDPEFVGFRFTEVAQ